MSTPITPTQAVTIAPKREIRVVEDDSPLSFMMDSAKFEHCYRIAEAMSRASLLPKHLRGATKEETAANCFLVVNQAMAWRLNAFLIAPETYEVGGKLGFQGKLVASVINTRAGIKNNLAFTFSGEKSTDSYTVEVSGTFVNEDEPRTLTVSVGQAKTSNSMWTKDPEQKLCYTGAIRWARRYAPEVVLGVSTEEDLEAMRDEARIIAAKPVKTPKFEGLAPQLVDLSASDGKGSETPAGTLSPQKPAHKRPTMVEAPLETKAPEMTPETKEEREKRLAIEHIMRLASESVISNEQLVEHLHKSKWMKVELHKLTDLSASKLTAFLNSWLAEPTKTMAKIRGGES